jgi:hypothetical protein
MRVAETEIEVLLFNDPVSYGDYKRWVVDKRNVPRNDCDRVNRRTGSTPVPALLGPRKIDST